jgi:excinuclease ABC subunit C
VPTAKVDSKHSPLPNQVSATIDDQATAAGTVFDGKAFCRTLTGKPGVYRMLGADATVLYVGKARNLQKRVRSYFGSSARLSPKVRTMVSRIAEIQVTVTHTEAEALLLESNLIKDLKPRYNITLRDDKSFPWIHLTATQPWPRLRFHRGARRGGGRYFGPYPNAGAVRASLNQLQKLFRIRNCTDSFFQNRTRPCLQYQIQRCTAPCVGLVTPEAYAEDVSHAVMFLEGRSDEIIGALVGRMEAAAERLDFELAARYRDQIADLKRVQQRQYVSQDEGGDYDVIAAASTEGGGCVQVFFIRGGHNLGNKSFFPANSEGVAVDELLAAFLSQYYLLADGGQALPANILVNQAVADAEALGDALSERAGRRISIRHEVRGERSRWLRMAEENARLSIEQRAVVAASDGAQWEALRHVLRREEPFERIECFDISHTMGEATVGACVVFGGEGPVKTDYRRFNIEDVTPGDDYGAMRQAIERRYARVQREEGRLPDVLLIDGGTGQVRQAQLALQELGINDVLVLGVAKGPSRKPGLETLILLDEKRPFRLDHDSAALHLIQRIRDEAHRFAITGHRQRRARARNTSVLEGVEGIGAKKRKVLIQHFGGLQGVARAGIEDLSKVPGISRELAQRIYARFHEQ